LDGSEPKIIPISDLPLLLARKFLAAHGLAGQVPCDELVAVFHRATQKSLATALLKPVDKRILSSASRMQGSMAGLVGPPRHGANRPPP
jgi:hypothetical protein